MSSRRARKKKKQDHKWLALLVLLAVFGVGAGFFMLDLQKNNVIRNKETLCRADGVINAEYVILIDATDTLNSSQAMLVKKELSNLLKNSQQDDKFTMYWLTSDIENNQKFTEACNPGDGQDKSDLIANKRRLLKNWNENFINKFDQFIDNFKGETQAETSPILELVKYAALNSFYSSESQDKKLILVSDMLHHTKGYSHYSQNPDFKSYQTSSYGVFSKPQLSNVDVEILYLLRESSVKLQTRAHITFWENYFFENGATLSRVKKVN